MLDLSIIIISFNTKDLTLHCINSIVKHTSGISYEIIVVDNASNEGSSEAIEKLAHGSPVILIKNKSNRGFSAGNNQGVKIARGKYLLFLNSDTVVSENVLGKMVAWMDGHTKVGVASCALKNKEGGIQPTGGYFPTLLSVFSWMTIQDIPYVDSLIRPFHPLHSRSFFSQGFEFYKKERELDWVTGAFLMTREEILDKVGDWDEGYFMYMEEVDLCFRIKKKGWQVWYLPQWSIIHYGGASSDSEFPLLSEYSGVKRFYKKNYPAWQYPILRFLLKLGALGRIVVFGILEGPKGAKTYAKAFKIA